MAPTKSRSQRKAAFEQAASAMYDRLEAWYDAYPDASFEEIEAEVRQQRRGLMGDMLATLIVGRDSGHRPPRRPVSSAGSRWCLRGLSVLDGQRARGGYRSGAGLLRLRCVCRADLFPLCMRSCGCGRIIGAVGRRVW